MRSVQSRFGAAGLAGLAALFLLGAGVPEDISGTYEVEETGRWGGAALGVVLGEGRLLLMFDGSFDEAAGACLCLAEGKPDGEGRYRLSGGGSAVEGTLTVQGDSLVLDAQLQSCCGSGVPAAPPFPRAARRPLASCTVKAQKAVFHGIDNQPTDASASAGDKVEASEPEPSEDTVLARSVGKTVAIGRLKAEDLECPEEP